MLIPPKVSEFNFLGLEIKYYGLTLALAMLLGLCVSYFICKKYYKDADSNIILDAFPIVILSGILGARLYYVLLSFNYYALHPKEILMIWQGGLSIHGALLGGLIGGVIYCRIKKIRFLKYADIFSYGLILAQAVGRWGNFFNSEAFGFPAKLPLLYIEPRFRPIEFINCEYFHPTFLYESILDILVFLILFFVIRKFAKKEGIVFFSYLLLYSIARLFVEAIRIDSVLNLGAMPIAQVVSILIILISAGALFVLSKRSS